MWTLWAWQSVGPFHLTPLATSVRAAAGRGLPVTLYCDDEANEAIRLSWCHLTLDVDCPPLGQPGCVLRTVFTKAQMRHLDWEAVAGRILSLR